MRLALSEAEVVSLALIVPGIQAASDNQITLQVTAPLTLTEGQPLTLGISLATPEAAGALSATDKAKLDGIAAGAQVNVLPDWSASSGPTRILNRPTLATVAISGAYADLSGRPDLSLKADLVGGLIPTTQLPALAVTEFLGTVANQAAMLALTGQRGDWAIRSDLGTTWVLTTDGGNLLAHWTQLSYPAAPVLSINGQTGAVVLSAADVGAATVGQLPGLVTNENAGLARARNYSAIAYAASIQLDMAALDEQRRSITLTGALGLTLTNLALGRSVILRVVPGASDRTLTLPIDCKVFGINPNSLKANKVYRVTIECWGATEAEVDIAIAEQI